MQCRGRHTLERKNIPQLKFTNKPKFGFFLPSRCKNTTTTEICQSCSDRLEKIPALLERWKGTMQNQSEQLHGLIGGPIPEWSRLYKSPYYESKIVNGWTIADESARIAEEAYTEVERDTIEMAPRKKVLAPPVAEPVLPVSLPTAVPVPAVAPKKKVIAPKAIVPPAPAAEPVAAPEPVPAVKKKVIAPKAIQPPPVPAPPPAPPLAPPPPMKPRAKIVKKVITVSIPTHIIEPLPEDPIVVSIKVKKIEIDGRTVYLNSEKDKVYDMKYNYLGRYNRRQDKIDSSYGDSDAEV
jgi:hypothetical protein